MSIREKICPKCGRSEKEVEFHGFICIEDFLATREFSFPEKVTIYECRHGDKVAADVMKWKNKTGDMNTEIARTVKAKKGKVTSVVIDRNEMVVHFEIDFEGTKIARDVPLKIKPSLCDTHQRAARGYFEAIVQVRSSEDYADLDQEKIDRLADRIERALAPVHVDRKEVSGGIDLYVDSKQATFLTLKRMKLKTTTTRKLGGRKGGKEVYRTTFLVRV